MFYCLEAIAGWGSGVSFINWHRRDHPSKHRYTLASDIPHFLTSIWELNAQNGCVSFPVSVTAPLRDATAYKGSRDIVFNKKTPVENLL